jgi:hypothetical protein
MNQPVPVQVIESGGQGEADAETFVKGESAAVEKVVAERTGNVIRGRWSEICDRRSLVASRWSVVGSRVVTGLRLLISDFGPLTADL